MTSTVTPMTGFSLTYEREPDDRCVKELERWLEMARSGEIIGVALAGMSHDGEGRHALAGMVGNYSMIGSLEVLKLEMIDLD